MARVGQPKAGDSSPTPPVAPRPTALVDARGAAAIGARPTATLATTSLVLAALALLPALVVLPSLLADKDLLDAYDSPWGLAWSGTVFLTPALAVAALVAMALWALRPPRAGRQRAALGATLAGFALALWGWSLGFVGTHVWPT